jgi:hypothetical protein
MARRMPQTQVELAKSRRSSNVGRTNPWSFLESRPRVEPAADFSGRLLEVSVYRRGGVWVRVPDPVDPLCGPSSPHPEQCMLAELLRRVSATMARYRNEGWCTPTELRTIEALWIDGVGLREFARRERVKPAAIGARIAGLVRKAPEFYRWWLLKHRRRRMARRDSSRLLPASHHRSLAERYKAKDS